MASEKCPHPDGPRWSAVDTDSRADESTALEQGGPQGMSDDDHPRGDGPNLTSARGDQQL